MELQKRDRMLYYMLKSRQDPAKDICSNSQLGGGCDESPVVSRVYTHSDKDVPLPVSDGHCAFADFYPYAAYLSERRAGRGDCVYQPGAVQSDQRAAGHGLRADQRRLQPLFSGHRD